MLIKLRWIIASTINGATHAAVNRNLSEFRSDLRFIPNITVHEFEALLFSDPACLASALDVSQTEINKILNQFSDPEKIDDSPSTAPSKRPEKLYPRYKKTGTGINIAQYIGIDKIRNKCRIFNNWISRIEALVET